MHITASSVKAPESPSAADTFTSAATDFALSPELVHVDIRPVSLELGPLNPEEDDPMPPEDEDDSNSTRITNGDNGNAVDLEAQRIPTNKTNTFDEKMQTSSLSDITKVGTAGTTNDGSIATTADPQPSLPWWKHRLVLPFVFLVVAILFYLGTNWIMTQIHLHL